MDTLFVGLSVNVRRENWAWAKIIEIKVAEINVYKNKRHN